MSDRAKRIVLLGLKALSDKETDGDHTKEQGEHNVKINNTIAEEVPEAETLAVEGMFVPEEVPEAVEEEKNQEMQRRPKKYIIIAEEVPEAETLAVEGMFVPEEVHEAVVEEFEEENQEMQQRPKKDINIAEVLPEAETQAVEGMFVPEEVPEEVGEEVEEEENQEMQHRPKKYIIIAEEVPEAETQAVEGMFVPEEVPEAVGEEVEEEENQEMQHRPKKGRKRKFPDQNAEIRKRKRNSNQDYVSSKGVLKEQKDFRLFVCKCRKKCFEQLSEEKRLNEYNKFWELGTYEAQNLYICAAVGEKPVGRKRNKDSERRNCTRVYEISGVEVCRDTFVHTFRISTKRVNTALTKMKTASLLDQRGVSGGMNKHNNQKVAEVIAQIKKIPKYKSHYRREKQSDRLFVESHVTVQVMYDAYKEEVEGPVSFATYKGIFYKKFNIRRKPLKKDTCNTCDNLTAKIQSAANAAERTTITETHDIHVMLSEGAQQMLKENMKRAKEDIEFETLTFDLEKTLPLPRIPTNIVFYKRQIWLYNSGVHSGKTGKGYGFVWVEGVAGRGSQEVGSCLKKYIETYLADGVKELVLWADSCGGQNRNIKIVLMLKAILDNHHSLTTITLRFLISGHSFLPNDSDFGDIETALKLQQRLYVPSDYTKIMEKCRKKNPFIVTTMKKEDFFGTAKLEKMIINRKQDVNKNKINWLKIREIGLKKEKPFAMFLKTSLHQEASVEVDLQRKERGRPMLPRFIENLEALWPNGKPISKPKLDDITSMMHLIPEDAQGFYRSLWSDEDVVDDIEGFNGNVDFEIQEED